jgi:hypothetical protein
MKLEQQCWRYLITILDADTNCEYLHELADRLDCPPLKLAAWKLLKEKVPDADDLGRSFNRRDDEYGSKPKKYRGTGLTGPGDASYRKARVKSFGQAKLRGLSDNEDDEEEEVDDDYGGRMPSVFDDTSNADEDDDKDDDNDDEDRSGASGSEDEDGNKRKRSKRRQNNRRESLSNVPRLEELDENAAATDVINAWALRLKGKYSLAIQLYSQTLLTLRLMLWFNRGLCSMRASVSFGL